MRTRMASIQKTTTRGSGPTEMQGIEQAKGAASPMERQMVMRRKIE